MTTTATSAGTFKIGGDLEVTRLGYGAMRITGKGIWGEPADRDECLRVLRRLPELGIDFIDTADSPSARCGRARVQPPPPRYSTVTVLARLRGWSTFSPRLRAIR